MVCFGAGGCRGCMPSAGWWPASGTEGRWFGLMVCFGAAVAGAGFPPLVGGPPPALTAIGSAFLPKVLVTQGDGLPRAWRVLRSGSVCHHIPLFRTDFVSALLGRWRGRRNGNWHDRMLIWGGRGRDNGGMGQLSLFSRVEIAGMRERTVARNYSPTRDEFRREHERRRFWGLRRRHAEKLRRGGAGVLTAPVGRGDRIRPAVTATPAGGSASRPVVAAPASSAVVPASSAVVPASAGMGSGSVSPVVVAASSVAQSGSVSPPAVVASPRADPASRPAVPASPVGAWSGVEPVAAPVGAQSGADPVAAPVGAQSGVDRAAAPVDAQSGVDPVTAPVGAHSGADPVAAALAPPLRSLISGLRHVPWPGRSRPRAVTPVVADSSWGSCRVAGAPIGVGPVGGGVFPSEVGRRGMVVEVTLGDIRRRRVRGGHRAVAEVENSKTGGRGNGSESGARCSKSAVRGNGWEPDGRCSTSAGGGGGRESGCRCNDSAGRGNGRESDGRCDESSLRGRGDGSVIGWYSGSIFFSPEFGSWWLIVSPVGHAEGMRAPPISHISDSA